MTLIKVTASGYRTLIIARGGGGGGKGWNKMRNYQIQIMKNSSTFL